jgi:hypothetical protein
MSDGVIMTGTKMEELMKGNTKVKVRTDIKKRKIYLFAL